MHRLLFIEKVLTKKKRKPVEKGFSACPSCRRNIRVFRVFRGLIWFLTPYLFISNSYSYYDLADREKDKFTLTFWSVSLAELPLSVTNKVPTLHC